VGSYYISRERVQKNEIKYPFKEGNYRQYRVEIGSVVLVTIFRLPAYVLVTVPVSGVGTIVFAVTAVPLQATND